MRRPLMRFPPRNINSEDEKVKAFMGKTLPANSSSGAATLYEPGLFPVQSFSVIQSYFRPIFRLRLHSAVGAGW